MQGRYTFTHRGQNFVLRELGGSVWLESEDGLFTKFFDRVTAKRLDRLIAVDGEGRTNFPTARGVYMPRLADGTNDLKAFSETEQVREYLDRKLRASLKAVQEYLPTLELQLAGFREYAEDLQRNLK